MRPEDVPPQYGRGKRCTGCSPLATGWHLGAGPDALRGRDAAGLSPGTSAWIPRWRGRTGTRPVRERGSAGWPPGGQSPNQMITPWDVPVAGASTGVHLGCSGPKPPIDPGHRGQRGDSPQFQAVLRPSVPGPARGHPAPHGGAGRQGHGSRTNRASCADAASPAIPQRLTRSTTAGKRAAPGPLARFSPELYRAPASVRHQRSSETRASPRATTARRPVRKTVHIAAINSGSHITYETRLVCIDFQAGF